MVKQWALEDDSWVLVTFPLLLLLAARGPYFAAGNPGGDYRTAIVLGGLILMYMDYLIFCPLEGNPIRFTGHLNPDKDEGVGEDDCATTWDKFKWTMRFMAIARGIGWNIQVKGVPKHLDAYLGRWDFVQKSILRAMLAHVRKLISVYCIGLAVALQETSTSPVPAWVTETMVGWAGASWTYNAIDVSYNLGGAITVTVGLCDSWEWPPMFGPLSEAWSVRQVWSVVWHQLLRRLLQQPGVRLVRLFGLRKGTLGSKYLQLYVAFVMSFLIHEWQIFNVTRHDVGEFRFFLVQPFVITAEDFVQWCWRKYRPLSSPAELDFLGKIVGYIWTFAWFSYCLPPYVEGLLGAGIIGLGYGEPWAMDLGRHNAVSWSR